jgi:hypothetical protein
MNGNGVKISDTERRFKNSVEVDAVYIAEEHW